jgi:hypothetical protein
MVHLLQEVAAEAVLETGALVLVVPVAVELVVTLEIVVRLDQLTLAAEAVQ